MFTKSVGAVVDSLERRLLLSVAPLLPGITANLNAGSITHGGYTFFAASDPAHGSELWRTNGTRAGTMLVKDINVTPAASYGSYPDTFMVFNDVLLFVASRDSFGDSYALWRTDGTAGGTQELGPLSALTGLGEGWYVLGGRLVGCGKGGLIETDGTRAGTRQLTTDGATSLVATSDRLFWLDSTGRFVRSYDGKTITTAAQAPAGATNAELDSSFGTGIVYSYFPSATSGTRQRVPIADRADVVRPYQEQFRNHDDNDELVFGGVRFYSDNQGQLWRVGATPADDVPLGGINRATLTASGNALYFSFDKKLYRTDGTAAGTTVVRDFAGFPTGPRYLLGTPSQLYFVIEESDNNLQPWKSDGTKAGTVKIADVGPTAPTSAALFGLAAHGSSVLVGVRDALWKIMPDPQDPRIAKRSLNIFGTAADDAITLAFEGDGALRVDINGVTHAFTSTDFDRIRIFADAGNDIVDSPAVAIRTSVMGAAGDDVIRTGNASDTLYGGDGNDTLYGGGNRDWLFGDAGIDRLAGGGGRDILWGGAGRDTFLASLSSERRDALADELLR